MPTPAIYRKFDEMNLGNADHINRSPDWHAWCQLDARNLLPKLVNDLEAPAFAYAPALGQLRATLEQDIQRIVRMSGSGSTLFTLADDSEEAANIAVKIRDFGASVVNFELCSR
jgi:4-diphosphocytidyl-2-C-methyl-D-erythritol kinase